MGLDIYVDEKKHLNEKFHDQSVTAKWVTGDSVGHEFAYPAYHMHVVHGICPKSWMFLFGKCR